MAQTSSMAVQPRELIGLVRVCGMTILVVYAPFLADLTRAARAKYRLLQPVASLSHGEPDAPNMLIEGDNQVQRDWWHDLY